MKLVDTTPHLHTPEKAVALAQAMQAGDDDGWTYVVVHDPKGIGYAFIEVYDDTHTFVERV